jgi:hypothetical protein
MSIYKHKHHIIPRHAGGTDDPSNIVELTIEEHAEAHRLLFEQYGRWQDEVAWKALAGMIGREEILKEVCSHKGERNPMYGVKRPEMAHRYSEERTGEGNPFYGKKHSEQTKEIMRQQKLGKKRPQVKCPHCSKVGAVGMMHRWHFDNCKVK